MAVNYEFYEEKAEQWKSEVEGLNDQTDAKLKLVTQSIEEIKNDSSGDMVTQLCNFATQMTHHFANLVTAVKDLVVAVNNIKETYKKAMAAILDAGANIASKLLGGMSV